MRLARPEDGRVNALREALRPFAEFSAQYPGHDDAVLLLASYPRKGERRCLTVGDMRRAARAYGLTIPSPTPSSKAQP